jgi:hypothetical protein
MGLRQYLSIAGCRGSGGGVGAYGATAVLTEPEAAVLGAGGHVFVQSGAPLTIIGGTGEWRLFSKRACGSD